jgi:SAM-dependent methyltransferase
LPDPIYDDERLAAIYDQLDPDRSDLDVYAGIVAEFGAQRVLDVGCGTGTFALLLAGRGIEVVGVDPAVASLDVARAKPGADGVRWIHGDASTLPPLRVDLATMTANVAQVFLTDDGWSVTLRGIRGALKPHGRLVFETRDPAREAWLDWNRDQTFARTDIPGVGVVETWCDITDVTGSLVTFRWTHMFVAGGTVIISDSTLRFRGRDEITRSLEECGYHVDEIRDAPDRPGRELVFIASRIETSTATIAPSR